MANAPIISRNSRFNFADWLDDIDGDQNGFSYFDLTDYPEIPEQADDFIYTVKSTDRIDSLASRFYRDYTFWWVIALANNMELLPIDLQDGDEILIPSPRYVMNELMSIDNKK